MSDIKAAVVNGAIIEDYPDDYPHPSVLILGFSKTTPVHVVIGFGGGFAWLVTAYIPDSSKWETDNKTRKVAD